MMVVIATVEDTPFIAVKRLEELANLAYNTDYSVFRILVIHPTHSDYVVANVPVLLAMQKEDDLRVRRLNVDLQDRLIQSGILARYNEMEVDSNHWVSYVYLKVRSDSTARLSEIKGFLTRKRFLVLTATEDSDIVDLWEKYL